MGRPRRRGRCRRGAGQRRAARHHRARAARRAVDAAHPRPRPDHGAGAGADGGRRALVVADALAWILACSVVRGVGFGILTVTGSAVVGHLAPPGAAGADGRGLRARGRRAQPGAAARPACRRSTLVGFAPVLLRGGAAAARHPGRARPRPPRPAHTGPGRAPVPGARRPATGPAAAPAAGGLLAAVVPPTAVLLAATMAGGALLTFLPQVTSSGTAGLALLLMGPRPPRRASAPATSPMPDPAAASGWLAPLLVVTAAGHDGLRLGRPATAPTGWLLVGALLCGTGYGALQNLTLVSAFHRAGPGRVDETSTLWNVGFDGGTALGAVRRRRRRVALGLPDGVRRGRGRLRARAGGRPRVSLRPSSGAAGHREQRRDDLRPGPPAAGPGGPCRRRRAAGHRGRPRPAPRRAAAGTSDPAAPCTTRVGTAIRWTSSGAPSSSPVTSQWLPAAAGSWLRSNIAPAAARARASSNPGPANTRSAATDQATTDSRSVQSGSGGGSSNHRASSAVGPGSAAGSTPPAAAVATRVSEATSSGRRSARRLGDPAAHREPDQVRGGAEQLDEGRAVLLERVAVVRRSAGRARGRPSGVAVVVAHDAAPAVGDRPAEPDVPRVAWTPPHR